VKITNNLNLPEPIVAAVSNDPYDNAGTLSVTTLLRPAQAVALSRKHADEIVEDAADRIWSLMGQIGHTLVERAAGGLSDDWVSERRYFTDTFGERISGQADLIHVSARTVYDCKFTSGWAVKDAQAKGKSDWQYQLSMLAMLAREGRYLEPYEDAFGLKVYREVEGPPIEITHGKIIAIVRDWTEKVAERNPDWPQKPVAVIDMDILDDETTREWIETKIEGLKFALDGGHVPCTDEERWHRPGKWAVYKGTNKTAAKLADSEDELSSWIFANRAKVGNNPRIEQRPGAYARCEKYCSASAFCRQHQETVKASDV
jgi:hypothetical protein